MAQSGNIKGNHDVSLYDIKVVLVVLLKRRRLNFSGSGYGFLVVPLSAVHSKVSPPKKIFSMKFKKKTIAFFVYIFNILRLLLLSLIQKLAHNKKESLYLPIVKIL